MTVLARVSFVTQQPFVRVDAPLDEEPPSITGGYATWNEAQRPRRVSLTEYQGRPPFRQRVPVLFDGFAEGRSVEAPVSRLERMALPGRGRTPPPQVLVYGPIDHPELTWVIESIEWGASLRNDAGKKVRQAAVVNLLEFVPDERLRLRAKPAGHPPKPRLYTVKRGDTLASIAAKLLGKASLWKEIARVNGIRDPRSIKPGQRLFIP